MQTELSEIVKSFREIVATFQAVEKGFKEFQTLYQLSIGRDGQDSVRAYHLGSSENSDSESDFSEFANFQQQYENENLSQQELEDLWEQFISHRIHESEEHESDFSEFANFQQQYENENLSQQELEDLWEHFNSHRIHESDDNFSSSEQQEEQEIEFEIYSNADENESLDPGGSQSPFSEASFNSADN